MGKYAIYIWGAYGIAFGVMAWMALSSLLRLRAGLKQLDALEKATGRRRRDDEA